MEHPVLECSAGVHGWKTRRFIPPPILITMPTIVVFLMAEQTDSAPTSPAKPENDLSNVLGILPLCHLSLYVCENRICTDYWYSYTRVPQLMKACLKSMVYEEIKCVALVSTTALNY